MAGTDRRFDRAGSPDLLHHQVGGNRAELTGIAGIVAI
jgi:hypothetical protein